MVCLFGTKDRVDPVGGPKFALWGNGGPYELRRNREGNRQTQTAQTDI